MKTLVEFSKDQSKLAKTSPLRMFWKHLEKVYHEGVPPLQCHRGCDYCCHTGVTCTQMEWDGILKNAEENGIDLRRDSRKIANELLRKLKK